MENSDTRSIDQSSLQVSTDNQGSLDAIQHRKLENISIKIRQYYNTFIKFSDTEDGRIVIKLSIVLLLYYLSLTGLLTQLFSVTLHDYVYQYNQQYIETASYDSLRTLEVVGSIKSILTLLQSLSGGVSFIVDIDVQLGESLSVINDVTDQAWKVSLTSVGATKALSLIHETVYSSMQPALVSLFLLLGLSIALVCFFPEFSRRLERLVKTALFIVLFTHLIVPLSIYATAKVSEAHFHSEKQSVHQHYSELDRSLPQHKDHGDLKDQVAAIREHFQNNLTKHTSNTASYSLMSIKHLLYTGIEFIILPIFLVGIFSLITWQIIKRHAYK